MASTYDIGSRPGRPELDTDPTKPTYVTLILAT